MKKMIMKKLAIAFAMGLLLQGTAHAMNNKLLTNDNVTGLASIADIKKIVIESTHTSDDGIITRSTYYGYPKDTRTKLLTKSISEAALPTIGLAAATGFFMALNKINSIILKDYPLALWGSCAISLAIQFVIGNAHGWYLADNTNISNILRTFKDYGSKRIPAAQLPANLQLLNVMNKESGNNNIDWFLRSQNSEHTNNNVIMNTLRIDNLEYRINVDRCDSRHCASDARKLTLPCGHSFHISCLQELRHISRSQFPKQPTREQAWCPICLLIALQKSNIA